MSIVICVIDRNQALYFASDLRSERDGIVKDDCKKIFKIRKGLYIGFTGALEPCKEFYRYLMAHHKDKLSQEISDILEKEFNQATIDKISDKELCTATLAGRDENNDLFFFTKGSQGPSISNNGRHGGIFFSIAGDVDNELVTNHLKSETGKPRSDSLFPLSKAIESTVLFASTQHQSISPECSIKRLPGKRT